MKSIRHRVAVFVALFLTVAYFPMILARFSILFAGDVCEAVADKFLLLEQWTLKTFFNPIYRKISGEES